MKEVPLYIPPNKKVTGLQVYCKLYGYTNTLIDHVIKTGNTIK
jgi:hypothetical protein